MSQPTPSAHDSPPVRPGKADEKAPALLIPIFKLPVFLYRFRLGWLLGKRFMQVTHVGRRSGKVRRTVLAVLRFDKQTKAIYVVSAWQGSDWYYNIQAAPALQVETGFVRYVPRAACSIAGRDCHGICRVSPETPDLQSNGLPDSWLEMGFNR